MTLEHDDYEKNDEITWAIMYKNWLRGLQRDDDSEESKDEDDEESKS